MSSSYAEMDEAWKDRDVLEELYLKEGYSQKEIAEELGCTQMNVSYWLDKHDIPTRDGSGRLSNEDRPWEDEALLRERYLENGETLRTIAADWECSTTTIRNWLDEHDIPRRDDTSKHNPYKKENKPWKDREKLQDLYDRGFDQQDIAEEFDCHQTTVSRWMDKFGVGR